MTPTPFTPYSLINMLVVQTEIGGLPRPFLHQFTPVPTVLLLLGGRDGGGGLEAGGRHGHGRGVVVDDLPLPVPRALVHEDVAGLGHLGALGGGEGDGVVPVVDGDVTVQADVRLVVVDLEVG